MKETVPLRPIFLRLFLLRGWSRGSYSDFSGTLERTGSPLLPAGLPSHSRGTALLSWHLWSRSNWKWLRGILWCCDVWLRAEWCTEPRAARASNRNAVRWISPHSLCQFKRWLTKLLVIKSPNISSKQEENKTETYHSRWTLILYVITSVLTRQQIYAGITFTHCQGTTHMQLLTHNILVR